MGRRYQHSEVMEITGQSGNDRIHTRKLVTRLFNEQHEDIGRHQNAKNHEAVRARLLRYRNRARTQRQQGCSENSCLAPEQPPAQQVHHGDGQNSRQHREEANNCFAVSEVQPGPEQDVVQRHVAFVMPKKMPEHRRRTARNRDAGNLVDPEALVSKCDQPQNRANSDDAPHPEQSFAVRSSVCAVLDRARHGSVGGVGQHAPNIAVQIAVQGSANSHRRYSCMNAS